MLGNGGDHREEEHGFSCMCSSAVLKEDDVPWIKENVPLTSDPYSNILPL